MSDAGKRGGGGGVAEEGVSVEFQDKECGVGVEKWTIHMINNKSTSGVEG